MTYRSAKKDEHDCSLSRSRRLSETVATVLRTGCDQRAWFVVPAQLRRSSLKGMRGKTIISAVLVIAVAAMRRNPSPAPPPRALRSRVTECEHSDHPNPHTNRLPEPKTPRLSPKTHRPNVTRRGDWRPSTRYPRRHRMESARTDARLVV